MKKPKRSEQHIAVFGESGSGKTVLVSSFYGAAQEPSYSQDKPFRIVANDARQRNRLHRNYLGMREEAQVPTPDRFEQTSYSFGIKLKDTPKDSAQKKRPIDEVRLIWHDYPGEWFESEATTTSEADHRVETFRQLLSSDIALVLVDGQQLLDHQGQEERYLKNLFGNFKNSLLVQKDKILDNGKPLDVFPRIWIMALSKADVLPEMDVYNFRDLLVLKASDELTELRSVLAEFVTDSAALSMGEDFVLLSSAKFEPGRIDLDDRTGVDLILPLTTILPLERKRWWAMNQDLSDRLAKFFWDTGNVALFAGALLGAKHLLGKVPLLGKIGLPQKLALAGLSSGLLEDAFKVAGEKLQHTHDDAARRHNYLTQMLTGFKLQLEDGEANHVFLWSQP